MEPTDRDLEHTAIRETWEETGIDLLRHGRLLGTLDDIMPRIPRLPTLVIRPFVAVVGPGVSVTTSNEVAEAFWVPVAALRDRASWRMGAVPSGSAGERQMATFWHGRHVVWGLTERVLRQFLDYLSGS